MTLLIGFVTLGLGWLVPGHFVPWLTFQQEWVAALGALLVGFAVLLPPSRDALRWPWLALLALCLAVIPLVQLAANQIKFVSDAVLASLYLAGFALTVVTGATLARTRKADLMTGLCGAMLVAGIASVGLAATQWLQLGPIGYITDMARNARPYANLAQPNHLASLLALSTVSLLWFFETRRINKVVACIALAWLAIGMVMTQSRTGWLFVIALAASALWMIRRANLRTSRISVAVGVGLFFLLVGIWPPLSDLLLVSSNSLGQRLQPGPRGLLWHALIDAVIASPWIGYGWTQVGLATQAVSLEHITGRGMLNNSHNLILDLFLWNGVPLGLLVVIALAWWFVRAIRQCRSTDQWLLLLGISAVFVHALLEYPLEYAYFLFPVGLMMGAVDERGVSPSGWKLPRVAFAAPMLLLSGMLAWIGVEYMTIEESTRQMRMVMMGIGIDKVSTVPVPNVTLLDAPREFHRFWLTHAKPGMTKAELDWMRAVERRNPVPPAQLRYALAAGLNDRPQEAADTLVRLCYMNRPDRCREGQVAWVQLQQQHPALRTIAFPDAAMKKVLSFAY